jgi:hypothetical protein
MGICLTPYKIIHGNYVVFEFEWVICQPPRGKEKRSTTRPRPLLREAAGGRLEGEGRKNNGSLRAPPSLPEIRALLMSVVF